MSQKNVNTLLYQHVLLVSAGELRKAFAHCLAQRREQVFTESREWLTCALEILEVFVTMCTHLFFSSNVSICIIYNVHVLFFLPLPNFHPITQSVSYSLTYLLIHSLTEYPSFLVSPPPPPPPPPLLFSSLPPCLLPSLPSSLLPYLSLHTSSTAKVHLREDTQVGHITQPCGPMSAPHLCVRPSDSSLPNLRGLWSTHGLSSTQVSIVACVYVYMCVRVHVFSC